MTRHQPAGFSDLQEIVDNLSRAAVVVIGDLMLDRFVYGEVERISPEAPVPVLKIRHESNMPGGAGNVLSNLRGLDVPATLVAVVGTDEPGRMLKNLVAEQGALIGTDERPTIIKTRFLAAHQQLLRADFERVEPVSAEIEQRILQQAGAAMQTAGAVILSDYGKGTLTPKVTAALIAMAKKAGIPVLVDPKGGDYTIYRGADVVTPNRKELAEATGGLPTGTDAEVVHAAQALMECCGIGAVVATRSQDGMSVIRRGLQPVHMRTEALEVFDVSGAGDTVIAAIAAALAAGADLLQAAALANCAGGIVVAKVGTAAIRRAELKEALARKELAVMDMEGGSSAVIDRARQAHIAAHADEAEEQIGRWQARGLKVGFTNGCFDILHPGHVRYLNGARDKCDRLVVGVNTDESVRRLKGPSRPVNDEHARASVLSALGSVDLVVFFGGDRADEDKAARLVGRLKPDVYFKGGDYKEENVPEAKIVRGYGGEVSIMPLYEGHSTTATIGRAKGTA